MSSLSLHRFDQTRFVSPPSFCFNLAPTIESLSTSSHNSGDTARHFRLRRLSPFTSHCLSVAYLYLIPSRLALARAQNQISFLSLVRLGPAVLSLTLVTTHPAAFPVFRERGLYTPSTFRTHPWAISLRHTIIPSPILSPPIVATCVNQWRTIRR